MRKAQISAKGDQSLNPFVMSGLLTLVWSVLCFVLLLGFDGVLSWVSVLLFGFFLYSSFMLWRTILKKGLAPLEIMFWFFHTNFLFLPALSQSLHRTLFWSAYDSYQPKMMLLGCATIAVGLLSFRVGTRIGQRRIQRKRNMVLSELQFLNRPVEATWKVLAFAGIIIAGLAFLIWVMGVTFFVSGRMVSVVESVTEFGIFMSLPRALAAGILLLLIFLFLKEIRSDNKCPITLFILLVAALALNGIVNFPMSIPRFWLFGFVLSLIWVIYPLRSVLTRIAFILSMTAMQFTILPWYSQITRGVGLIGYDMESIRRYLQHGDFDGFEAIVNSIIYINDNGFELGRNIISVALFFVPRFIWESKAQPLGVATADFMGYEYTNLCCPIYGELFADLGFCSLILAMGILGFAFRFFDSHYDALINERRFGIGVLLVGALSGYLIILLRGSLLAVVASIAVLFGVLIVGSLLAKRTKRSGWIVKEPTDRKSCATE